MGGCASALRRSENSVRDNALVAARGSNRLREGEQHASAVDEGLEISDELVRIGQLSESELFARLDAAIRRSFGPFGRQAEVLRIIGEYAEIDLSSKAVSPEVLMACVDPASGEFDCTPLDGWLYLRFLMGASDEDWAVIHRLAFLRHSTSIEWLVWSPLKILQDAQHVVAAAARAGIGGVRMRLASTFLDLPADIREAPACRRSGIRPQCELVTDEGIARAFESRPGLAHAFRRYVEQGGGTWAAVSGPGNAFRISNAWLSGIDTLERVNMGRWQFDWAASVPRLAPRCAVNFTADPSVGIVHFHGPARTVLLQNEMPCNPLRLMYTVRDVPVAHDADPTRGGSAERLPPDAEVTYVLVPAREGGLLMHFDMIVNKGSAFYDDCLECMGRHWIAGRADESSWCVALEQLIYAVSRAVTRRETTADRLVPGPKSFGFVFSNSASRAWYVRLLSGLPPDSAHQREILRAVSSIQPNFGLVQTLQRAFSKANARARAAAAKAAA